MSTPFKRMFESATTSADPRSATTPHPGFLTASAIWPWFSFAPATPSYDDLDADQGSLALVPKSKPGIPVLDLEMKREVHDEDSHSSGNRST